MTDEPNNPRETPDAGEQPADSSRAAERSDAPREDDKAPSSGRAEADAGTLPQPPRKADEPVPTPESQAALTGKAPSGSSTSGTTVPAASSTPTSNAPPAGETPEEKNARLKRVVEEAKARKAAQQGGEAPPPSAPDPRKTAPTADATAASPVSAASSASAPPGGASPAVGDPLKNPSQSDLEKAAKIAEAKARAAAARETAGAGGGGGEAAAAAGSPPASASKPAAAAPTAAGAPKAPVKKKEEGPKPEDASSHPLVKRLSKRLDGAVVEAFMFLGQLSVRISASRIVEVCDLLRRDDATPFNYLSDLTCVHLPERADAPFEIVYHLYSISANERVRLKVATDEREGVESVTGVWPTANWMEREVYDLFGVRFKNHPDLRRLLLPADWEGHPLRKDYPLEFMENNWTTRHLPEFTDVQQEQLEQRRAYGLELLSSPHERRVREIFRAGKEVMPLDRK